MIKRIVLIVLCFFIQMFQSVWAAPVDRTVSNFRFVVMSDAQGLDNGINSTIVNKIMKNIKSLSPQPEFAVLPGDLCIGSNSFSEVKGQLEYIKKILTSYYPISFFFPGVGNHETSFNSSGEFAFRQVFSEFSANFLKGYEDTVYYFDYGNSRFFMLNSDYPGELHKISFNQLNWLKSHVINQNNHNFFFMHEPPFPTGTNIGFSLDFHRSERNLLWSIIDSSNGPMSFSGHEHFYSRRHIDSSLDQNLEIISGLWGKKALDPTKNYAYSATNYKYTKSIFQITLGGFGGALTQHYIDKRNVDVPPIPEHCYAVVDVNNDDVEVNVYNSDGKLLDSFKQSTLNF